MQVHVESRKGHIKSTGSLNYLTLKEKMGGNLHDINLSTISWIWHQRIGKQKREFIYQVSSKCCISRDFMAWKTTHKRKYLQLMSDIELMSKT